MPKLSEYVHKKLIQKESHLAWSKLIQECAYHFITFFPQIGLDNSSGDYREIGSEMFKMYPSIARDGTHPWSFFTKCLSQKIRRIRWDKKRRSVTNTAEKTPSPKRFSVGPSDMSEGCDEEMHNHHVKEMAQEIEKKEPSITHMKTLLKATFARRREWIQQLPPGSVKPILDKYPCFKDPAYILAELRYLLKVSNPMPVLKRFETVFQAVSSLMSKKAVHDDSDLTVMIAIESETAYRKGKVQKTNPVVQIVLLEQDGKLEQLLYSKPKSAPKLVAIEKDEQLVNMAIVCDGVHILLDTTQTAEAIVVLLGLYYVADLDYPKVYSQLLGFLQQTAFQQPFEGHKSYGFIQFLKRISLEIGKQNEKENNATGSSRK